MRRDDIELDANTDAQRRTLLQVFTLNAGLSATLFVAGIAANSAALIANGADNASDAAVYALSYFAATRGER
jgi:Co/Zn/Cd efflux system component